MKASLWMHTTDVAAEGASAVFAALEGMGVRELSLAATYHAGRFLLPHAEDRAVKLLEDGVAYYAPDPARWEKARLRPKLADACHGRNAWREVRDMAQRAGIAVNAWVVALHNSRLGAAHPDCTLANAFGDRYEWGLCPSHPEVRAYAVELALEIVERLEPAALELEACGYMGYAHQSHHDKCGVRLDGAHDFLLSLCFCDGCARRMAAHGVGAPETAGKVRELLRGFLERGRPAGSAVDGPGRIERWLAEELGPIETAGLLAARRECVVTLVQEIRRRLPRNARLHVVADPSPFVTGAAIGGALPELAELADALILNLFHRDRAQLLADVRAARAAAPRARFIANLRAFAPDSEDAAGFLEKVEAVKSAGIDEVRIYHYGLMPRAHFHWVREALSA
jgi:hypothetical protein